MTTTTHARDAGFTLIEVLVALAIVGAAVLLAAPATRTSMGPQLLRSTASDMAALARATRAAAIRTGGERVLSVDLTQRTFSADGVAVPRTIPATLGVDVAVAVDEAAGGAVRRIRFLPTGGSSGGRIVLSHGTSSAEITVDWLTGGARVATAAR